MGEATLRTHPGARADIRVWDTQYCAPSKAFAVFREAICSNFMPWSPEFKSGCEFDGRVEGVTFGTGALGRVQMTPLVAVRNKLNIANSSADCFFANYVLNGELKVEQSGRTNIAKRGDFVVYDSSLPVTLTGREDTRYDDLSFRFQKDTLNKVPGIESHLNNVVFTAEKMIAPLAGTLAFLSENLLTASQDELDALYKVCVSLLPVAAGYFANKKMDESSAARSHYLLRQILEYVNSNIANGELSPLHAAQHVGISVRYVHKLFAASGTTFSAYVMSRRLDHVRRDLSGPACGRLPIFVVAYRWGFNDLSTFIRAFKKRFGCSPSRFRATA